ncbi:MAG: hypothetical protein ACMUJM_15085 [bacterium]
MARRGKKIKYISLLVMCAIVFTIYTGHAQVRFEDISVSPQPFPISKSSHGYMEYTFCLTNHSPVETHEVTLQLPDKTYYYSANYIGKISKTVLLGPSSRVSVSLLKPPLPLTGGTDVAVLIDGIMKDETIEMPATQHGYYSPSAKSYVLISRSVNSDDLDTRLVTYFFPKEKNEEKEESELLPTNDKRDYVLVKSDVEVPSWSANWLAYTQFDGIVIRGDDMKALPPLVKTALWRYVECGGSLLVMGRCEVPSVWNDMHAEKVEGLILYNVGFGICMVSRISEVSAFNQKQLEYVRAAWSESIRPWCGRESIEKINDNFPVIKKIGIPVRGIFLLMILFAIIIGPLNIFILARKNKRIWMIWSVPLIAFITTSAVFVYFVFAEGFASISRTEAFTLLDQSSHRATTIGLTAFYSSLTPGKGLHFSPEAELTPVLKLYGQGTQRMLDWSHDQHLSRGWVTARVPAHFLIRKSQIRREQLQLIMKDKEEPCLVNGLGVHINQLWLADKNSVLYCACDIPPGKKITLQLCAMKLKNKAHAPPLRNIFISEDWVSSFRKFSKHPEDVLIPGSYIAFLDDCPFIEGGLETLKNKKTMTTLFGILGREEVLHES